MKKVQPTKAAIICYTIMKSGPSTRMKLLEAAHNIQNPGKPFKPTSNVNYFTLPKPVPQHQINLSDEANRLEIQKSVGRSLPEQGLIIKVGETPTGEYIWSLTHLGLTLALSVKKHFESCEYNGRPITPAVRMPRNGGVVKFMVEHHGGTWKSSS